MDHLDKKKVKVTSLIGFLKKIAELSGGLSDVYYRGQADSSWEIESSAYREINKKTSNVKVVDLKKYHISMLENVKKLPDSPDYLGLKMLTHLQHNYAKTLLTDYSYNPLVALWFCCIHEQDKDGAVYCYKRTYDWVKVKTLTGGEDLSDLFNETDCIYCLNPDHVNQRVTNQQSVFLFNASGKLPKQNHKIITIKKGSKSKIINELSHIGINRKNLFHDFHGFVDWYEYDSDNESDYRELCLAAEREANKFNYESALKFYSQALEQAKKADGKDHTDTATTYDNIATVYTNKGDYTNALEWYEKALVIKEKELGTDHPSTATTYNNMAGVYDDKGYDTKALELYEKALVIYEKELGKDHLFTATTYNNMAGVYRNKGDDTKALELFKKALAIYEKELGTDHPSTATTYNNMAMVYKNKADYTKANELYGKADGWYEKALEWYEKALAIKEKALGTDHPSTAATYNNMAGVYKNKGDGTKALEWYEKAYDIFKTKLGLEHPRTKTVFENMQMLNEDMRQLKK